jgi:hypothetical protein
MTSRPDRNDLALLAALMAVLLGVTYAYVGAERFFYYWDFAVHQDIASATAAAFRESWTAGWRAVGQSLREDYNALFALPLAPVLGRHDSRMAYEMGLALTGLLPFALAVGALATRVVAGPARTVFWTATWLTLLVPMSWVPTLRGYPDAGAAALITIALAVYLRDDRPRRPREAALIGVLLAAAVLYRRHFLYAALAFTASALLFETARAARSARGGAASARGEWIGLGQRVGAGGLAAAATMGALGQGFLTRLWSYDFARLYRAYEEAPRHVVEWYADAFGLALIGLAVLGALAAARAGLAHRAPLAYLALFAALSTLQWVFFVRQLGEQYTLHVTPLLVLGLTALLFRIWSIRAALPRALARTALAAILVANALLGLTVVAAESPVRRAFGGAWVPLIRWDYDEVARLVDFLRGISNAYQGVYVIASSHTINADLVRHAEQVLHGRRDRQLDVLPVPTVDSRDYYPLNALLEAEHVVLVRPLQTHLRPEEQKVLAVVYDLFASGGEIARDFTARPERFELEDGALVTVFSRDHPTGLATALRTLAIVESAVPTRPGQLAEWTVVNRRFRAWVSRNPDGSTSWAAHPAPSGQSPSTVLAWNGPSLRHAEVRGTVAFVDRRCPGATLELATAQEDGTVHPLARVRRRPDEDGRFQVEVAPERGRLVIRLLDYEPGGSIDYCLLTVDPLVVRPAGS